MNPWVSQIWRHTIKSIGAERIKKVRLSKGKTLPWDRVWALTYSNSRFDVKHPKWSPCQSFLRGSVAPRFAAVTAKMNEGTGFITLMHPDLEKLEFNLDNPNDRIQFIEWVLPICPENSPAPAQLCKVPDRGMTDTDYPSISLNSTSSLRELSAYMGVPLHPRRFRGNIWIDGLEPWHEEKLIGKKIKIGSVVLCIIEPIKRCNATKNNEKSGVRDLDTLNALQERYGHKNFGVYCTVSSSGNITEKDTVQL
jgi:uncharacterized protein YcbX